MAQQKIVYLVTSGDYENERKEAILKTPELAEEFAATIPASEYPNITAMPVLDYVPVKITVWEFVLKLDPITGWIMWREDMQDQEWDYRYPEGDALVSFRPSSERRGDRIYKTQFANIYHRDQATARYTAEALLEHLQTDGIPEPEYTDAAPY